MTDSIARRVSELAAEIRRHDYNYHVLDMPTIGDSQYDLLMTELKRLESDHPEFVDPNSPTQREFVTRSVKIKVAAMPLGAASEE